MILLHQTDSHLFKSVDKSILISIDWKHNRKWKRQSEKNEKKNRMSLVFLSQTINELTFTSSVDPRRFNFRSILLLFLFWICSVYFYLFRYFTFSELDKVSESTKRRTCVCYLLFFLLLFSFFSTSLYSLLSLFPSRVPFFFLF